MKSRFDGLIIKIGLNILLLLAMVVSIITCFTHGAIMLIMFFGFALLFFTVNFTTIWRIFKGKNNE